jgi:hypothetical protein
MITQKYLIDRGFAKCPRINELNPTLGKDFICHQKNDIIVEVDYKDIAIYFENDREVEDYTGELSILILERHDTFDETRLDNLLMALYDN